MWCSEVFEVRCSCYVTSLVLEHTVWCSQTVRFFVMFDMFEVRFWAKMWCSESSMFGHSMFGVFKVQYFGVRSNTNKYCLGTVYWIAKNGQFFKVCPSKLNLEPLLCPKKLVLEQTVRCSRTIQFFMMFNMFDVRFWTKMWCSEVFEVRSCCYVTRLVLEPVSYTHLTLPTIYSV